jgi:hypothetical protein
MEKKQVVLDLTDRHVCQQTTEVLFGIAKCTVGKINKKKRGGSTILKAWEVISSNKRIKNYEEQIMRM